jgi:single-strand DNA-binding protein
MEQQLMELTNVTIAGNITADPEIRWTQQGRAVVDFTIAASSRRFNKQTQEWEDGDTTFLRASAWRDMAENIAGSLRKGDRVIATGRLKQRSYETQAGEKRSTIELDVDEIGPSLKRATAQVTRAAGSGNTAPQRAAEPADSWTSPGTFGDDSQTPF